MGLVKGGVGILWSPKSPFFILLAWFFNEACANLDGNWRGIARPHLQKRQSLGHGWFAALLALLSFREFRAKMVRLAVHCGMYARHTEIAKIAFFVVFAVLLWEVPETAARSRSENRHFRLFRRKFHTQIAKIAVRSLIGGSGASCSHSMPLAVCTSAISAIQLSTFAWESFHASQTHWGPFVVGVKWMGGRQVGLGIVGKIGSQPPL